MKNAYEVEVVRNGVGPETAQPCCRWLLKWASESGSAAGTTQQLDDLLNEDGALEHLAGGRGRRALRRDEDAQVDEPGTCYVSLVDAAFAWDFADGRTYRS